MSQQLESMLAEIKKSLPEKIAAVDTSKAATETGDPKQSTAALREFLSKHVVAVQANEGDVDDPKVIVERRTLLSAFIGAPLTNNGVAALQGVISKPIEKASEKSGHNAASSHAGHKAAPVQAFAPVQEPVVAICPSCIQAAAKSKAAIEEEAKAEPKLTAKEEPKVAPKIESKNELKSNGETKKTDPKTEAVEAKSSTPAISAANQTSATQIAAAEAKQKPAEPVGAEQEKSQAAFSFSSSSFSMSAPQTSAASPPPAVVKNEPAAKQASESPQETNAKPAAKQGFGGFLAAAFKRGKEPNPKDDSTAVASSAVPPAINEEQTPQQSAASVAWFKHIQAVESALRIGDVHFADTFLSLLYETSSSLSAQPNIVARLNSLRARVLLDRKQYAECEQLLKDSIAEIEATKFSKNVATAYCWHALAQCYHNQKMAAEAASALNEAITISETTLGKNDPETMYFKEALK